MLEVVGGTLRCDKVTSDIDDQATQTEYSYYFEITLAEQSLSNPRSYHSIGYSSMKLTYSCLPSFVPRPQNQPIISPARQNSTDRSFTLHQNGQEVEKKKKKKCCQMQCWTIVEAPLKRH